MWKLLVAIIFGAVLVTAFDKLIGIEMIEDVDPLAQMGHSFAYMLWGGVITLAAFSMKLKKS